MHEEKSSKNIDEVIDKLKKEIIRARGGLLTRIGNWFSGKENPLMSKLEGELYNAYERRRRLYVRSPYDAGSDFNSKENVKQEKYTPNEWELREEDFRKRLSYKAYRQEKTGEMKAEELRSKKKRKFADNHTSNQDYQTNYGLMHYASTGNPSYLPLSIFIFLGILSAFFLSSKFTGFVTFNSNQFTLNAIGIFLLFMALFLIVLNFRHKLKNTSKE